AEYRHKLIEMAVEQDDAALEAYLGGQEPDEATLIHCIRKGAVKVMNKPWDQATLLSAVETYLQMYESFVERKQSLDRLKKMNEGLDKIVKSK
ncbi:MAG: hypothetical protein ACREDR_47110, partial [Blastocatellia bacterium]